MMQSRAGNRWSYEELQACVAAYFTLLEAEKKGEKVNKEQVRRHVMDSVLFGRSDASYEYRLHNISSVLIEMGLESLERYKPLKNIGSAKKTLINLINETWGRAYANEAPTEDADAFFVRVLSAQSKRSFVPDSPPPGTEKVRRTSSSTERYVRDPEVSAWVLNAANGVCGSCNIDAPFSREDGRPYLEVYHVRPLAEGGPDIVENAIAICPNCHRELHLGEHRQHLAKSLVKRIPRLQHFPKKKRS